MTGKARPVHWSPKGWEGGRTVGETLNPQAGKPANTVTERANGVFRSRQESALCPRPSAAMTQMGLRAMAATLYVCITCKAGEIVAEGAAAPGARLFAALQTHPLPSDLRMVPVECLSACNQGNAVALQGAGKWGYVYGRLTPDDAADIIAGASAYAKTADGIVPWRERPIIFRKQSLARIPPLEV